MSHISEFLNDNKEKIIFDYINNKFGTRKLAVKYNCDRGAIIRFLHKNKIIFHEKSSFRKYNLNFNFFENIDAESKAYFLGFLYADGYMNDKNGLVSLSLAEQDKEILDIFTRELRYDAPLVFMKAREKGWQNKYSVIINHKKIFNDLKKWGLFQRKSLLLLPDPVFGLSDEMKRHFIRGYFDGDGHFGFSLRKRENCIDARFNICCTKEMSLFFKAIFEKLNIITKLNKRFKDNKNCFNFYVSGNQQIKKVMFWLYKDSNFYLKRKHDKFLKFLSFYENGILFDDSFKRPVNQFDLENNFIATYPSILDASKKTGAWHSGIGGCLSGRIKQTAGFRWEYACPKIECDEKLLAINKI